MSETLFRHEAAPIQSVFDVHVNALPVGTAPPKSFYRARTLASMVELDATIRSDGFRLSGGCVSAPAGVNLLDASLALKSECQEIARSHGRWSALLRFDEGGGDRPVTDPMSRLRDMGRHLARRVKTSPPGDVSRAILADPDLLDGFVGVKLMPQMTGLPGDDVLELLGERSLPILVHAGSFCPVDWIRQTLLPRSSGPVILAHLGSWPCSATDLEQAVRLAEQDSRVYLETSGASIGNFIRHAAERVPDKLLFGSNSPMCPASVQWQHVASSIADDQVLAGVAGDNARRVFDRVDVRDDRPGQASEQGGVA